MCLLVGVSGAPHRSTRSAEGVLFRRASAGVIIVTTGADAVRSDEHVDDHLLAVRDWLEVRGPAVMRRLLGNVQWVRPHMEPEHVDPLAVLARQPRASVDRPLPIGAVRAKQCAQRRVERGVKLCERDGAGAAAGTRSLDQGVDDCQHGWGGSAWQASVDQRKLCAAG